MQGDYGKDLMVAGGDAHSLALIQDGTLSTWGQAMNTVHVDACDTARGLRHADTDDKLTPTRVVVPKGVRFSMVHSRTMTREQGLALAMATHHRLGAGCVRRAAR